MYTIRPAADTDIERMAEIEALCFPAAEAATLESFQKRFAVFPECFFVLEVSGIVVGHINGCAYSRPELPDALYSDDNAIALTAMNAAVEDMIAGYEAQYQWQYKRFRLQPPSTVDYYDRHYRHY